MIIQAKPADVMTVARLALQLWPSHTLEDLAEEFAGILGEDKSAVFVMTQEEETIGFAQCHLRVDYVEGTHSSPVGYLEGIFVRPEYRGQGRAGELLGACEDWARSRGCAEFASDCEWDNTASQAFHLKKGFAEVRQVRCFAKRL